MKIVGEHIKIENIMFQQQITENFNVLGKEEKVKGETKVN